MSKSVQRPPRTARTSTQRPHGGKPSRPPARGAAESGAAAPATATKRLTRVAGERSSGDVRRKNVNVDQGLLDAARARFGLDTETEAIALGLAALLEVADFRAELLAGFDELMAVGGLRYVEGEEADFSGFPTGPDGGAR